MGWYGQRESYEESYAPDAPNQPPDARSYGMRGVSLSRGAPPYIPGGPPQSTYPAMIGPQPMEPVSAAPVAQSSVPEALSVPLATLGGLIGGIVSAAIWAIILETTRINFSYVAFLLGIVVGLGVALGARGHHDIGLSLFAGALGIFAYCLALYFRLGLGESHASGGGLNFFALSLNDFSNIVGDYLVLNPINFLNFVLVPLAAMGTAYRYINRGRDRVS
jgi:hypothetical protein